MKVRHLRTGREMKLANVLTFMANERVASEDAVAGDIIGIHNHGQLSIGDTLTEGETLEYKGIPYFAPELFRVARPRDPFKSKPLTKGLRELGEEGAIQVFESTHGSTLLLGANLALSSAAPTISSGFGTGPSVTAGTSAAFRVNVGTGGAASAGRSGSPAHSQSSRPPSSSWSMIGCRSGVPG